MTRGGRGGNARGGRGNRQNSNNTRDRRYNLREVNAADASGDVPVQNQTPNGLSVANSNTSVKSGPRNRRPAASINLTDEVQTKEKTPVNVPPEKVDDDDPDYLYRSKLPKDPKYGYGIRYNPADPNAKIPVTKIYVSRFGTAGKSKLTALFSKYGNITDVALKDDVNFSYAFITFEHPKDALKALAGDTYLGNRKLVVREAYSNHQPVPTHIDKLAAITAPSQCYIAKLNDDCLRGIFNYLDLVTRTKIEVVCKRWQTVSRSMWLVVRDLNFCQPPFNKCFIVVSAKYDEIVKRLTSYTGHNLASLTIKKFHSADTMQTVQKNCISLERLTLIHFAFYEMKVVIPSVKILKHLSLEMCNISDKLLAKIFSIAKCLESISLVRHSSGTACLETLSTINTLSIVATEISFNHFEGFLKRNGAGLKRLTLIKCPLDEEMYEDAVEKIVEHAPNIEVLKLDRFNRATETLKLGTLHKLTSLRSLSLTRNTGLTADILTRIARHCKQLECVTLDNAQGLTRVSIEALGKLPKLNSLSLCNVRDGLSNEALIGLVNNLTSPSLLRRLLLTSTSLSDEALYAVLTLCPGLELLDIAYCRNLTEATLMTAEDAVTSRTVPPLFLTLGIDQTPMKTAVHQAREAGKKFSSRLRLQESSSNLHLLSEALEVGSGASIYELETDDDTDLSEDDAGDLLGALNLIDSDEEEYMYLMGLGVIDDLQFGEEMDPDNIINDYLGLRVGGDWRDDMYSDDSDNEYYPE